MSSPSDEPHRSHDWDQSLQGSQSKALGTQAHGAQQGCSWVGARDHHAEHSFTEEGPLQPVFLWKTWMMAQMWSNSHTGGRSMISHNCLGKLFVFTEGEPAHIL